ncbi:MAG: helix-turn-helix transcriptional regulator [Rhizobiales bacterium]|nr:helix-turn-helix transcriptional regulator [Hyphomicrobiales bacterium]
MKQPKIAKNLKTARGKLGFSLSKAAEETGVSKAMLGQVERGESSPTIATLWKIAKGFHIPLSTLIDEGNINLEYSRQASERPLKFENSIGFKILFPYDKAIGTEMYLMSLEPEESHVSIPHDVGVIEDIVVIKGNMEILLDGVWTKFKTGDAIRFKADVEHGYRNMTNEIVEFHNIIHYKN